MLNTKNRRKITPEIIKLSLDWVYLDISLADVARKLDTINMNSAYTTIARALKQHLKDTK